MPKNLISAGMSLEFIVGGYRPLTKTGGYKSIPESIISKAVSEVGLEGSKLPEISVSNSKSIKYTYTKKLDSGKYRIVFPRRLDKRQVPNTLKHELAHVKLGHTLNSSSTYGDYVRNELEALKLQRGYLSTDDIESVTLTMVLEEGLKPRDTISVVYWEAKDLGTSSISLSKAQKWLRKYFKERALLIKDLKSH